MHIKRSFFLNLKFELRDSFCCHDLFGCSFEREFLILFKIRYVCRLKLNTIRDEYIYKIIEFEFGISYLSRYINHSIAFLPKHVQRLN